ncbi:MAG: hypothetical protein HY010_06250 [Acidobacteria bacterium]|nr:hypothetical protein [Acidobacteriota bacterium]
MKRFTITTMLLMAACVMAFAQQPATTLPPQSQIKMTTYVLGIIRKGPHWGEGTAEERKLVQDGHMANIRKMASMGKLIVAGPIDDTNLRGIFIFGIGSVEEAKALVKDDPAIASERLVVDFYPWYAAVGLKVDLQTISATDAPREQVVKLVTAIQRADYEGDRPALHRLYSELDPFVETQELASRVRYWRGFALWRRAFNGFNESADPKDLADDLERAVREFQQSAEKDPNFADAKIGAASCLSNLMFLHRSDPAKVQELLAQVKTLLREAGNADPGNPRLSWVTGPNLWYAPPEYGGSQEKAMETYLKGLESAKKLKATATTDPLNPSWGEPELLMNLAWSNLHRTTPDIDAAESYARKALDIVPYWHYVRDILLPQIRDARKHTKLEVDQSPASQLGALPGF